MPLSTPPTSLFPFYLLPSIPFRRRSSTSTPATAPSLSTSPTSSPPSPSPLHGSTSLLRCTKCLTHICPTTSIISKGFTGRHGRAYLVSPPSVSGYSTPPVALPRHHDPGNLPNTHTHKPVPRQLVTGAHTVSDISCVVCGVVLGWKYVAAEEEGQKYKEGCFILETRRVFRGVDWDNESPSAFGEDGAVSVREGRKDSGIGMEETVEFDSQDEDECEDLFMGIWTPSLAKKRRRAKNWDD
ncbi:yippee-domain-containing protein [Tothia fuscella]|uniref:Yippee-domain-containing protein n=1 Tax=Tothia fuscella TaxID=1048955 RepID=A0A9P4P2K5_9PEZI|nr:yippee-domain-containing protein [Tothia fuscella]